MILNTEIPGNGGHSARELVQKLDCLNTIEAGFLRGDWRDGR